MKKAPENGSQEPFAQTSCASGPSSLKNPANQFLPWAKTKQQQQKLTASASPAHHSDITPGPGFVRETTSFRVGRLGSANRVPVSVNTNTKLKQAATLMLMNDFSQLPVIDGNTLKGMISWKTIGGRLSCKCEGDEVRHFMENANEISSDESMLKAIDSIVQNGYILVRSMGRIAGIITTSDLSTQFRQLIEPYLLLAEIENQIRNILGSKLTLEEIRIARDPGDPDREISCISDLSFGEYLRIFQHPDLWRKLDLEIDRKCFTCKLDEIRNLRNGVMHFDPHPLSNEELVTLRNFWDFLNALT